MNRLELMCNYYCKHWTYEVVLFALLYTLHCVHAGRNAIIFSYAFMDIQCMVIISHCIIFGCAPPDRCFVFRFCLLLINRFILIICLVFSSTWFYPFFHFITIFLSFFHFEPFCLEHSSSLFMLLQLIICFYSPNGLVNVVFKSKRCWKSWLSEFGSSALASK